MIKILLVILCVFISGCDVINWMRCGDGGCEQFEKGNQNGLENTNME